MSAINSRQSISVLRRYLDAREPRLERKLLALWKQGRDVIDAGDLSGSALPATWLAAWQAQYTEFVNDELAAVWLDAIGAGAEHLGTAIERYSKRDIGIGDLTENRTELLIQQWVQTRGGRLITNLTARQFDAVRLVLEQHVVGDEILAPQGVAMKLRPHVGLDLRQSGALAKYRQELLGTMSPAKVDKLVDRYSQKLLRARATKIARTEMSEAYNMGSMLRVEEALEKGELKGTVTKGWLTAGDERVCPECGPLEGTKVLLLAKFESSKGNESLTPPMHPMCRCTTLFSVDD